MIEHVEVRMLQNVLQIYVKLELYSLSTEDSLSHKIFSGVV